MTLQAYTGSCHCGAVRFEADLDLAAGSVRCNCSRCLKTRHWGLITKPAHFRLLAGADQLTAYGFARFCKTCGVRPFGMGNVPEIGGDFVSIQIAALDGLSDEARAAIPVSYSNGRDDKWWDPPAVTGFL